MKRAFTLPELIVAIALVIGAVAVVCGGFAAVHFIVKHW